MKKLADNLKLFIKTSVWKMPQFFFEYKNKALKIISVFLLILLKGVHKNKSLFLCNL